MLRNLRFFGLVIAVIASGVAVHSDLSADVVKDGTTTTSVHLASGQGVVLNSADYYGSGNDDEFSEYGITTFNYTSADFGATVVGIVSAELTLTVNDRTFSDGDEVEVFFTPDTGTDLDNGGGLFSALEYDGALVNGINGAQYVTAPTSLGVFSIPEMAGRAGGETDTLSLNFGGASEAALINAINNGTDFQLILGSTDAANDITYSGVGNTFDPGDPSLNLTASVVPEPSTAGFLFFSFAGLAGFVRRRR